MKKVILTLMTAALLFGVAISAAAQSVIEENALGISEDLLTALAALNEEAAA